MMDEQACLLTFFTARVRGACSWRIVIYWRGCEGKGKEQIFASVWTTHLVVLTDLKRDGFKQL